MTPYNVANQGVHCLLTGFSIKNRIKATKQTRYPSNDMNRPRRVYQYAISHVLFCFGYRVFVILSNLVFRAGGWLVVLGLTAL